MVWRLEKGLQITNSGGGRNMRVHVMVLSLAYMSCFVSAYNGFRPNFDDDNERSEILRNLVDDWEEDELARYFKDSEKYDRSRVGFSQDDDFQRSRLSEEQFQEELRKALGENQERNEDEGGEGQSTKSKTHNTNCLDSNDQGLDDIMARFQIDFTELDFRSDMQPNYIKVTKFLKTYQTELKRWRRKSALAMWNKETNLTTFNIDASKEVSLEFSSWEKKKELEAEKFSKEGLTCVQKRMLKFITQSDGLKEKNLEKTELNLEAKISEIYSKAEVCQNATGKCFHFEPGLIKIMSTSHDYDELLWAWKGWRDSIGPKIRKDWIATMDLGNKGAREHGYHDMGEYHRKQYEDPNFVKDIDDLWDKLEPIYKQLHAYIRYKLHQKYGSRVPLHKPIPAHLLGDMWAMKWDPLLNMVRPFPDVQNFDVTKGMKNRNMTVDGMFHLADDFYQSLGLPKMTTEFWKNSMFTRPKDNRSVVCYASAHNLEDDDVRVKMCAAVTAEYLYVVHHEMGHCQYYLAYNRHQPELFQSGANHGFHEAIGDTAALSVIAPAHLEKLKIIEHDFGTKSERYKRDLNFLMQKALGKLAFYPFALTMAKWNWDVYSGKISSSNVNAAWWQYRKRYQGLMPPVERTEQDFDAGSKYHIANFVPYVRYFISHVLQFQFYESLCDLADHKGPLHQCDFAGSKKAGDKFGKMLQMGNSKPWPEALKVLTGTTKMNVDSIIKYFDPLIEWLKAENKRLGNKIGWD